MLVQPQTRYKQYALLPAVFLFCRCPGFENFSELTEFSKLPKLSLKPTKKLKFFSASNFTKLSILSAFIFLDRRIVCPNSKNQTDLSALSDLSRKVVKKNESKFR